jgi:hypothetical protein
LPGAKIYVFDTERPDRGLADYHQRGPPMDKFVRVAASAAIIAGSASAADAAVVFADNFDSYAYQLNWAPPANWIAPGPGAVDLIGETTTSTGFDFDPGNGGYVDLDGSNEIAGTLQTTQSFGPGTYTLTFDLGGNARGDVSKTTTITLGDWSTSLTLPSSAPLALQTFTFTTSGGQLSFSDDDAGNQDMGNILDNVTLSSMPATTEVIAADAPEASTWAMMLMGFAGLGAAGYRRVRKANAVAVAA